jgi:hypothetical protein
MVARAPVRWLALVLASMVVVAACAGGSDEATTAVASTGPTSAGASTDVLDGRSAGSVKGDARVAVPLIDPSPPDVAVSGLSIAQGGSVGDAPQPLVNLDEIISGGPPPDGIPSIDQPVFLHPGDVDFLAENEPVLALEIEGDHRAYPVQILMWHEIVNDTVGGIPVAVTYCPCVTRRWPTTAVSRARWWSSARPVCCGTRRS